MRRLLPILIVPFALILVSGLAGAKGKAKGHTCATIQDGTILGSDGAVLETGYDDWGYNYQARSFNGFYCDAYRDAAWCQPYADVRLRMTWNDAWLSNKDCDGGGHLDRHAGHASYIGTGAWLSNHQSGEYAGPDGEVCHYGPQG